jgi:PhnB protein
MQLNAYLTFNGQCEIALKFYEQVFGGQIESMIKNAGTPAEEHVPPEWREKILHARMNLAGTALLASDAPPGKYHKPRGFSVSVQLKDTAQGERIFKALAENGSVQMAFEKTFWAAGFGMCTDQFGIPWMINCE